MPWLQEGPDGTLLLTVHAQPRASRNAVAGLHGNALKISVTAPPADNKANEALVKFLAKLLKVPQTAVILDSGQQSRAKRFRLHGITMAAARATLETLLPEI